MSKGSYDKNIKQLISNNRSAYYNYFIEEEYEAGIVLQGTEVKSLRVGKASLAEAHADQVEGEIFLLGMHIPEYTEANRFNHYPRRQRKLLLHSKEKKRLSGLVQRKGLTLIPLMMYFNKKNLVKLIIGVARGKKIHDKRETIKTREWQRQKARVGIENF